MNTDCCQINFSLNKVEKKLFEMSSQRNCFKFDMKLNSEYIYIYKDCKLINFEQQQRLISKQKILLLFQL